MSESFYSKIEQKTGVKMSEVFALANEVQHADFSDPKQVKKIVRKVAKVANKPINKELEEKLVQTVVNSGKKLNMQEIQSMIQKNSSN
ncbi:stage VI sporulation protein F [Paenisporosarcina cavernae]|uniref:Sporulation protein n=1 Tax=Paenisporosarcina cavernae TaxID=2320858 RepID=A0A385YST3_9BACL|nr:stage VI sporulation protein F [Paenisporosarcina cavernae]AYC29037.1 sporulation protein [Paenisporosarcina cavernae]